LAERDNDVTCVDVDREEIDRPTRRDIPIYEPGLSEQAERNSWLGRLRFSGDFGVVVAARDRDPNEE
jgi:UDPglucose 6-dehydrogenase